MMRLPPSNMAEMVTFLRADGMSLDEALDIARARFPDEALVARYEVEVDLASAQASLTVTVETMARLVALARKGLNK